MTFLNSCHSYSTSPFSHTLTAFHSFTIIWYSIMFSSLFSSLTFRILLVSPTHLIFIIIIISIIMRKYLNFKNSNNGNKIQYEKRNIKTNERGKLRKNIAQNYINKITCINMWSLAISTSSLEEILILSEKLKLTLDFQFVDFLSARLLGRVIVPEFPTLDLIMAAIMLTFSPGPLRP